MTAISIIQCLLRSFELKIKTKRKYKSNDKEFNE